MDLSIIIPIYNAEATIERCVNSILRVGLFSYELLLIDDGSIDDTSNICNKYKDINEIHYVRKENGGVSSARNLGLQFATGEYIFFVDSDDFLESKTLINALSWAKNNKLEVVEVGHYVVGKNGGKKGVLQSNERIFNDSMDNLSEILSLFEPGYVWGKLYSRKLFLQNGLEFNSDLKFAEDLTMNLKLMKYVNRVGVFNDYCYNYVELGDGLSTKYVENLEYTNKCVAAAFKDLFAKYPKYRDLYHQKHMCIEISNVVNEIRNMYKPYSPFEKKQRQRLIKKIVNSNRMDVFMDAKKEELPKITSDKMYCFIIRLKIVRLIDYFFYMVQKTKSFSH